MKTLRLLRSPAGKIIAANLPLRMPRAAGVIDPEPFRARALGIGPRIPEKIAPCGGLRTLHLAPGQTSALFAVDGPFLTFVVSGSLTIEMAADETLRFDRGDLFLMESEIGRDVVVEIEGELRLVQLMTTVDWPGDRAKPVRQQGQPRDVAPAPTLKRMFEGGDAKSRFRGFEGLFGSSGEWSALTPVTGFHFIEMADGLFIDWHPEVVNNLVLVLAGQLELEVGGEEGAVEVFGPGDVCLAEDRTGQGHIDRARGNVQVCVVIIEDDDLWPVDDD